MAEIEMQDPLSTEIQSPMIAGIVEALNRISNGLEMSSESLTKVSMTPVLGLDPEDPRRIYQVADGNRLWVSSPEPQIYVNNSQITSGDKNFTIDFIGGSITFEGEYRPEEGDSVSVSCSHIYAAPQTSGGCEIIITFSPGFSGRAYSVTSKKGEVYTGTVPTSLVETVRVKYVSTEYTIFSFDSAGKQHSTTVSTGEYYGQVEVTLSSFSATIVVNTEPTAGVTVTGSGATYYATANEYGKASVIVAEEGDHSATSVYKNANSNTTSVNVMSDGETYTTTVSFITLVVTVDSGSTVEVKNGDTTLTETASTGTAKFWLPNTGTWSITASLDGQTSSTSVECSSYREFSIEISYAPDALNDCTWGQIQELSASGKISSYYDVGDVKNIVLNGTIEVSMQAPFVMSNFSIDCFIVGFNHNSSIEGNNITHFQIGKLSNKLIAICDTVYGGERTGVFQMGSSSTDSWENATLRRIFYNNGSTSNTFFGLLPSELRSVMKSVTKYSYVSSSSVAGSAEYLSALSEFEIFGSNNYSGNTGKEKQYDYYKSGNSKVFYNHSSTNTSVKCWLRSPSTLSSYWCYVTTSGNSGREDTRYDFGVSPIFFV